MNQNVHIGAEYFCSRRTGRAADLCDVAEGGSVWRRFAHLTREMKEELIEKGEELRALLLSEGEPIEVSDFLEIDVEYLLGRYGVLGAKMALIDSRGALRELQRLEKVCDKEKLRELFLSGNFQVGGRDRDGRGVLWIRGFEGTVSWAPPFAEPLVYVMWMMVWFRAVNGTNPPRALVIIDETGRNVLDFNLRFTSEMGKLMRKLFIQSGGDCRNWYFLRNKFFTSLANLPAKILGVGGAEIPVFESDKRQALKLLEDPTDYPDWFLPGGSAFIPSFASLGNFVDVIERRNGFERLTIRDIHHPDPVRIEATRLRCELEVSQLDVAITSSASVSSPPVTSIVPKSDLKLPREPSAQNYLIAIPELGDGEEEACW